MESLIGLGRNTQLLDLALPLNRKERYFTGTVFPMIVAADGFRDLRLLTDLLGGCRLPPIDPDPRTTNIQFFTEYSLVESIYGKTTTPRFPDPPKSKDTPDILILVQGEQTQLFALEAKMYDRPSPAALADQMRAQRVQLDYLQCKLALDTVYHAALLPEKYAVKLEKQLETSGAEIFPIITWEQLLAAYRRVRQEGDYFLSMLAIALERWDELVAKPRTFRVNAQGLLAGDDILDRFKDPDSAAPVRFVGRRRGLHGAELVNDVATGHWRDHKYEVRFSPEPLGSNPNWFTVEEFVKRVDAPGSWRLPPPRISLG